MNRRGALAMLGGSLLLARTVGTKAQTAKSVRHIGSLGPGSATNPAFLQRVWAPTRALGWIEGQNLIVERRYAQGKAELLKSYAEELVRLNVELIVTNGTAATIAAKNATTRIPIVMYSAGDPVLSGLVASLARPGGNITGFSIVARELDAKRLELLQELLPTAQRVAVLIDPTNPYNEIAREERERVYRSLGVQPIFVGAAAASELENAVSEAARRRAQALIVPVDNLFWASRVLLMRTALEHRLPTIVGNRDILEAGGLLSLAIDEAEQNRALAYFVDKILRGAKPADLPVQQPSKLLVSVNLKTAKALGFTIPQSLLLRADEVIE
jgi:putative ABC transport system substrate-binding protein